MRTLLSLSLFTAIAFGAPVPPEAKKTPLDKMQGGWIIVSLDNGQGSIEPMGDFATYTLTIEGDKLSTRTTAAPAYRKLPVKCDFKSDPMQLNVQFGDSSLPGIFKFDKDRLHWCHAQAGKPRPTEFRGGNGDQYFIWKRIEK
jgi:uncharacterized protein (TIGR03067 family)